MPALQGLLQPQALGKSVLCTPGRCFSGHVGHKRGESNAHFPITETQIPNLEGSLAELEGASRDPKPSLPLAGTAAANEVQGFEGRPGAAVMAAHQTSFKAQMSSQA